MKLITANSISNVFARNQIEIIAKSNLTLAQLISNGEQVLGRKHYRDRKITIKNIRFAAGVNTVTVTATSTGRNGEYSLNLIFYGIKSLKSPHKQYPLKIKVDNTYKYFQKPKLSRNPVRCFCGCKWFQFASEWYLEEEDALQPKRKARPYKRKTDWMPSPNPNRVPCVCKHVYQLALQMNKNGYLIYK